MDRSTTEPCSICLQPIGDRAVAVPCNHLSFDFSCLREWTKQRAACPICQTPLTKVEHAWRDVHDFQTYTIHSKPQSSQRLQRPGGPHRSPPPQVYNAALERRKAIYREQLYSRHVGANSLSRHRNFDAAAFASSSALQTRARAFLRRELLVFAFLDSNRGQRSRDYLMEYLICILKTCDLRGADGRAEDLVAEHLGRDNAKLLLHELESWLRSPYQRPEEWDDVVQYSESTDAWKRCA